MIDFPSTGDLNILFLTIYDVAESHQIEGDLLNILGMVGIVFLTIMIPVAVALFKDKNYDSLDRSVILEHVVEARSIPRYLSLIYAPLILWGLFSFDFLILQILSLVFWAYGVRGMMGILSKSYLWMKGDNLNLRFEYLKKLNASNDLENARKLWRSVWAADSGYDEKEFFIIFSSAIDTLLRGNHKSIRIAYELMKDFNTFIDKRSVIFLLGFKEVFPKILEWNFFVWKKQCELQDDGDIYVSYTELSWELSSSLKQIEERALGEKEWFLFTSKFKSHVEKYKTDFIEGCHIEERYVKSVMGDFFDVLLRNIERDQENIGRSPDIWRDFPSKWKVTVQNIEERENYISMLVFNMFASWASPRTWNSAEYDKVLSDVIYYLFPEVCPIMWARILTFLMCPRDSGKRMKSLIERPINLGGFGRSRSGWVGRGDDAEKELKEKMKMEGEAEEKETIDLTLLLFGRGWTEEFLNEHISELEAMKGNYSADSNEEILRKVYIDIFKRINARRKEKADE